MINTDKEYTTGLKIYFQETKTKIFIMTVIWVSDLSEFELYHRT